MGKIEFDKSVIPYLLKIADRPFWVDYDSETDTLYISFRKPQKANDSIMEEGMIYHYDEDDLVGITVLNAESYCKN